MLDERLAAELAALAPPIEDIDSLAAAVRARHAQRRRARLTAATGLGVAIVGVAGAVSFAGQTDAPARSVATEPGSVRRGPGCAYPDPFEGLVPGTDSASVTRTRGSAPTRLVAHAGVGDMTLDNLKIVVGSGSAVVRTVQFGTLRAEGQPLVVEVGDTADDGTPIAPGKYAVQISAEVMGPKCGGERHWVDTQAGILVVR